MSDLTVKGIGLTILDRTGTYDYEWSEFAVMRGSDGYLYVGDTGGCSCNDFEENLGEITRVASWQEAATKATEWAGADGGPYLEDEKRAGMDLAERLTKSQPAKFEEQA